MISLAKSAERRIAEAVRRPTSSRCGVQHGGVGERVAGERGGERFEVAGEALGRGAAGVGEARIGAAEAAPPAPPVAPLGRRRDREQCVEAPL